ncbi:MAG: hypothetical protein PHP87_08235 [Syntrophomonas sp.]|uniref:hypothetical protein n=1 Tax=Syntrophomonas sp. TaxID=2053627 RepID=UPI00261C4726|nr:hypothetical protein [Syntrophomonas sp.]MDD4627055.1 hypothetical protein [Syntrophomonas sp.]
MLKRYYKFLIIFVLCTLITPQGISNKCLTAQAEEYKSYKMIVMCYADCWRNSANRWIDETGYDGTVYPALKPDGPLIAEFRIREVCPISTNGQVIVESVEAVPSVVSQELYNSLDNKDNIWVANTSYGDPIWVESLDKLNYEIMPLAGRIGGLSYTQSGSRGQNADITLNNVELKTITKDPTQAVPSGISGEYLPNHTGNAPTVQGRRIFFPLILDSRMGV